MCSVKQSFIFLIIALIIFESKSMNILPHGILLLFGYMLILISVNGLVLHLLEKFKKVNKL